MPDTVSETAQPPARTHGRTPAQMRPVALDVGPLKWAEGSTLISMGDTRILVAASVESRVPRFLVGSKRGWTTAEYAMLPRATSTRSAREIERGKKAGRSAEIQRLIGRSLRAGIDLEALSERTLTLDCDVLQADGGTRTASITGAWVATVHALGQLYLAGDLKRWPVLTQVAAVSVGIVDGTPLLDLDSPEDQRAAVDLNVVGTSAGEIIEVQGTGEERPYSRAELDQLLDLAQAGIADLCEAQRAAVAELLEQVDEKRLGRNAPAKPKDESSLWGRAE